MRPGALRVESLGSVWFLDFDAMEYLRMPRTEGGRERAEWGDKTAGPLQDLVWHHFDRVTVEHPEWSHYPRMVLWVGDDGANAPLSRDEADRVRALLAASSLKADQ